MPTYTLSSGETFDTIVLPKGTVLFRGFEMMHGETVDTEVPFTELFGRQDDEGHYCVDPHHNTFFYPAPYMVDVVNRYSIHAIYLINYDLELVSMVRPSLQTRDARGKVDTAPYAHCTDIAPINKCGKRMIHHDPCLSPLLIKEFPNIHGYVAIAANDAGHYMHGYFPTVYKHNMEYAKSTVPFVVENARKIQSVPEIVLYPYHARISDEIRRVHPRAVDDYYIQYALKHRAELNYFPLCYITEKKIYTWNDLESYKTRKEMGETVRNDPEFISAILEKEKNIVQHALNPSGIRIHGVDYKFTVDLRTGFYVASHKLSATHPSPSDTLTNIVKLYRQSYTEPSIPINSYIVPFEYPRTLKQSIRGFLRRAGKQEKSEEDLVMALNRIGASFSKHYQFDIAHPTKFKTTYKLETMFPRPDIDIKTTKKRFTRKTKRTLPKTAPSEQQ
jgi:hypothetical protein